MDWRHSSSKLTVISAIPTRYVAASSEAILAIAIGSKVFRFVPLKN
jgi:hypothetical protein